MTRSLLNVMARPVGPANRLISFEQFLEHLRPFNAGHLAAGFSEFAWKGWAGEFATDTDNALAMGVAGPLAALALAAGNDEGVRPNYGDIIDLHVQSLAVDSTSDEVMRPMVQSLARLALTEPIAAMVPDLDSGENQGSCRMRFQDASRSASV